MADFIETITTPGQKTTGTLDGTISTNEQSANMTITDQGEEVLLIDKAGILHNDLIADRVRLGRRSIGDSGLFVSEPGIDVDTASDDELIFNSNQNVFKIVDSGTVHISHPTLTGTTTVSVPHTLGFAPSFMAYTSNDGGLSYDELPYIQATPAVGSLSITRQFYMSTDNNSAYFTVKTPTDNIVPIVRDIKYYLLQETAN